MVENLETYCSDVLEKIAVLYSISLSDEDKQKLIAKYVDLLKKVKYPDQKQANEVVLQFVNELKSKKIHSPH